MELNDFSDKDTFQIEDFQNERVKTTVGSKTASHLAASTAMLTKDESDYQNIKSDLMSQGSAESFIVNQQARREALYKDLSKYVGGVVSDPEVGFEEKEEYVSQFSAIEVTTLPPIEDEISYSALAENPDADSDDEANYTAFNMSEIVSEENARKKKLQSMVNATMLGDNPTTADQVVDVVELMAPFAEWRNAEAIWLEAQGKEGDWDTKLLGNLKSDLYKMRENVPIDEREDWARRMIEIIDANDSLVFSDGNDLVKYDLLQNMVANNDYSDTEKFFDNLTSVLDVTGVLGLIGRAAKGTKGAQAAREAANAEASLEKVRADRIKAEVSPSSISENIKDVNPKKADELHKVMVADETDEAAEAIYGGTKQDAVVSDLAPEMDLGDGKVKNKAHIDTGTHLEVNNDVAKIADRDGQTYYTIKEKDAAKDKISQKYKSVSGMDLVKDSLLIKQADNGGIAITALYKPLNSGFKSVEEAMDNAEHAFRHIGVGPESFTLYKRTGDSYEVMDVAKESARRALRDSFVKSKKKMPKEVRDPVNYAVGIKTEYKFEVDDFDVLEELLPKRTFLDRLPVGHDGFGSLTQHLLDPASVIHPTVIQSASAAVDRGAAVQAALVENYAEFVKGYQKLKSPRKADITDYINEANSQGIKYDETDLISRGFNKAERDILKEWRKSNDLLYTILNKDSVRSLSNRGYKVLVDKSTNTQLFVKKINSPDSVGRAPILDTTTGKASSMSSVDKAKLYEDGGFISRLAEPANIGGNVVEYVISREKASSSYTRAFRDNDTVLNYREGWYPIMYDAEHFIIEKVKMPDGSFKNKAVATSRTHDDAQREIARLQAKNSSSEYHYRRDRRVKDNDVDLRAFGAAQNQGLSAQRYRGETLKDADNVHNSGLQHLVDPLEAVSHQIASISERTSVGPWLEAMKERWIKTYGKDLNGDVLTDKYGNMNFPETVKAINPKSGMTGKRVSQARAMYAYIRQMEKGFVNNIDDSFKAVLHLAADTASEMGLPKSLEKVLNQAAKGNITSAAKGAAFKLLLAANPQRQVIIQAHQNVQLLAREPAYITKGGLAADYIRLKKAAYGIPESAEDLEMWEAFKMSGFTEAVDTNNIIRKDMLRLAETTVMGKTGEVLNAPLKFAQRAGFDVGEQSVLMMAWLTERHRAVKEGMNLNASTYDTIAGRARNFTFDMNRAGEMPYNQNSLNVALQFLQVPHKAVLQQLTNRGLTPRERVRLSTFNVVMYGVPVGIATTLIPGWKEVPEDVRDTLEIGLEDWMLNEIISVSTGTDTNIDFSDLAAVEYGGMTDMLVEMVGSDLSTVVANSPSGSLLFGQNPRITNMAKTFLRKFNVIDDYDDPQLATKYSDVAIAFANLASGMSNTFKAKYALESQRKLSSLGNITDREVNTPEAIAQIFGFRTRDENDMMHTKEAMYEGAYEANDNDIRIWYNALKSQLARRGVSPQDDDMATRVLAEGWRVFNQDGPKAVESLKRMIDADLKDKDSELLKNIYSSIGSPARSDGDLLTIIETLPDTFKGKEALKEALDNYRKAKEEVNG